MFFSFSEQCVDLDTLRMLSADDLKDLVPVIGHRAKLAYQIAMFIKDIVTDAFSGQNTVSYLLYLSISIDFPPTLITVHALFSDRRNTNQ